MFPSVFGGAPSIVADFGTRAFGRIDLTAASSETSIRRLLVETNTKIKRLSHATRMRRIIELAPLSLRLWAGVFHVSHNSIKKWRSLEPDREELAVVLELLERAGREHGDLAAWLQRPVASTSVTPLKLLAEGRWLAFTGAIDTASAPPADTSPAVLQALREDRLPWAIPDTPGIPAQA